MNSVGATFFYWRNITPTGFIFVVFISATNMQPRLAKESNIILSMMWKETIVWFYSEEPPFSVEEGKGMRLYKPAVLFSNCFDSILVMR